MFYEEPKKPRIKSRDPGVNDLRLSFGTSYIVNVSYWTDSDGSTRHQLHCKVTDCRLLVTSRACAFRSAVVEAVSTRRSSPPNLAYQT